MGKDVYLTYLALVVVLNGVTSASNLTRFICHGDYCNVEHREQFCSDVFKKCRLCSEVLDDCFTPTMPQNCTQTCLTMMCTQPPPIKHGRWLPLQQDTKQFSHGYILHVQCNTGYSTDSSALWKCQEGLWQSNKSFIPTCLKQEQSSKSNLWLIIAVVFFVLLLVSVIGNCFQCWIKKRHFLKRGQMNLELGQHVNNPPNDNCQSQDGIHRLLDNKSESDDSPDITSLNREDKLKPEKHIASESTTTVPQPNMINGQTKENTKSRINKESEQRVVNVYVNSHNFIENKNNNNNNTSTVNTSVRTVVDQKPSDTRGTNGTPHQSHYSVKPSVEETGISSKLENPDEFDTTPPNQHEQLPDSVVRTQFEEILNDAMPTLSDSLNVNESLNLNPLGGTAPMKNNPDESSSAMLPQAAIGTQPLKPDDGYRSQQEDHNAASPRLTSEDLADSESDEDVETSSLLLTK